MKAFSPLLVVISMLSVACNRQQVADDNSDTATTSNSHVFCKPGGSKLDMNIIEHITGMKGTENNGEYKISVPQNDLNVIIDGFKIIPPMGLSSWAAFTPCADSAMVMGDIIVTETDLAPVQREVIKQGFAITAIHNHFVRNHPNVMYMHIDGKGMVEELSKSVKAIFDRVSDVRGADPENSKADSVHNSLNLALLDSIVGFKGEMNKGVYKYIIGRPDVALREHGMPVSNFMGFNTWSAWQGTPDRAAMAGDFAMLADEVEPVIQALLESNIEVVAVHNHMVHERPRIFFLHYWGVGSAEKLARGFKAALDRTGRITKH